MSAATSSLSSLTIPRVCWSSEMFFFIWQKNRATKNLFSIFPLTKARRTDTYYSYISYNYCAWFFHTNFVLNGKVNCRNCDIIMCNVRKLAGYISQFHLHQLTFSWRRVLTKCRSFEATTHVNKHKAKLFSFNWKSCQSSSSIGSTAGIEPTLLWSMLVQCSNHWATEVAGRSKHIMAMPTSWLTGSGYIK